MRWALRVARVRAAWRRYRSLAQRGERAAGRYLRWRGYRIVARRERDAFGELDLIAVDGRTIVFVEVNTRRSGLLLNFAALEKPRYGPAYVFSWI